MTVEKIELWQTFMRQNAFQLSHETKSIHQIKFYQEYTHKLEEKSFAAATFGDL